MNRQLRKRFVLHNYLINILPMIYAPVNLLLGNEIQTIGHSP